MEELLLKAETSQDTPNWVLSNVKVMGQNAVTEILLNNPEGMGNSLLKWRKYKINIKIVFHFRK